MLGPPPSVIESKKSVGKGKVGIPIDPYLFSKLDYDEWWATQTCGPLAGPIDGQVSSFAWFRFVHTYLD